MVDSGIGQRHRKASERYRQHRRVRRWHLRAGVQAVAEAFAENSTIAGDIGAAVSVIVDGRHVVDLWGGERCAGRPWQRDTIVNVWSSTKGVVALAAQMLVDRGLLDLDAPVADVLAGVRRRRQGRDPCSLPAQPSRRLERRPHPARPSTTCPIGARSPPPWRRREPWWAPGTASGYHALTFGYLVGEVIRRVERSFRRALRRRRDRRPAGRRRRRSGLDDDDIARCATLTMDAPPPDSANAAMFAQLDPAVLAALANPSMAAPGAADIANADALAAGRDPGRQRPRHGNRAGHGLRGARPGR